MKLTPVLGAVTWLLFSCSVQASQLETEHGPVILLDVQKNARKAPESHLQRRGLGEEKTWDATIDHGQVGYFAKVRVGTPPQDIVLHLDTGSADIWFPDRSSSICQQDGGTKCFLGSYDANQSDSLDVTGANKFRIIYFDNSYAIGDYIEDTLEIGGARVPKQTMGLARQTSVPYGLAGIGYSDIVALAINEQKTYDNLPVRMYKQGLINTVAYSLWLNDLDAEQGSLLFGGIDKKKFTGPLKTVPVIKNAKGNYDFFAIALTSVSAVGVERNNYLPMGEDDKGPVRAILDSGATLSFLPNKLAKAMWREAGAVWFRDVKAAMIPCSKAHSGTKFAFQFGGAFGPRVEVGMDELVLNPQDWPRGRPLRGTKGDWKGEPLCQFGVRNFTREPYILGDSFMRSAYLVHDLVNNEVGVAQTRFNVTDGSDIVAFPRYGAQIPKLEGYRVYEDLDWNKEGNEEDGEYTDDDEDDDEDEGEE